MKSRKLRRIWGEPWDYCYLLELEQYKLKEMAAYFKKSQLTTDWEFQVRDIELCIKLIDIVLEKDQYYSSWLHNCYGSIPIKRLPFPIYVNNKNYKRFIPLARIEEINDFAYPSWVGVLRQEKALYLYNKIRSYRMGTWWD